MSNIEQAQDRKPRPSIRRFAGIVAVFVLLGPPAGGLAVAVWLAAVTASSDLVVGGMSGSLRVFSGAALVGAAFGLPLSYVAGLIPASVIGLATAAWDARKGAISLVVALGGALALGLLAVLRVGNPISVSEGERIGQISLLLAHLAAAGLCWLVVRAIFGRRPASNTTKRGKDQ